MLDCRACLQVVEAGQSAFRRNRRNTDLPGRGTEPSQERCNEKRERHGDDYSSEQTSAFAYIHARSFDADGLGGISPRRPQSGSGCFPLNVQNWATTDRQTAIVSRVSAKARRRRSQRAAA